MAFATGFSAGYGAVSGGGERAGAPSGTRGGASPQRRGEPVAGARFTRIPEGRYVARAVRQERGPTWPDRRTGRLREALYLHLRIVGTLTDGGAAIEPGSYAGATLFMPMNLTFRSRAPRPSSAFYRAWCVAMDRLPRRGEAMSLKAFLGKVFEVDVATVVRDADGHPLPTIAEYSKIRGLVRWRPDLQLLLHEEPQTEDRRPETEDPIPPSPPDSQGSTASYGEVVGDDVRRRGGHRAVEGDQKQASQPEAGP